MRQNACANLHIFLHIIPIFFPILLYFRGISLKSAFFLDFIISFLLSFPKKIVIFAPCKR